VILLENMRLNHVDSKEHDAFPKILTLERIIDASRSRSSDVSQIQHQSLETILKRQIVLPLVAGLKRYIGQVVPILRVR
jgi:hypothetical protein